MNGKSENKSIEQRETFETMSFSPEVKGRQGEGGLRMQKCFKKSFDGKPLVTVITVVFNGDAYLEDTIKSVINQTYDNIEYIIIDGGSTDRTISIIKAYEDKIDYWLSERDNGIYNAFNKGIRLAQGEWISFLGADDTYLESAIMDYIKCLGNDSDKINYISSKGELVDVHNRTIRIIGKPWLWKEFRSQMKLIHVGSLHNKKLFDRVGLYNEKYRVAGDYELLLRAKSDLNAIFMDKVTVKIMIGGVSHEFSGLAYKEALIAKIDTAKRMVFICYVEYIRDILKSFILQKIR